MKKMKVNLIDIAKEANVSLATVSLVLRNKNGISEDKVKKVKEIARNMGYVTGKNKTLNKTLAFVKIERHGHILNDAHKVFLTDYIQGCTDMSKKLGYKLEILSFKESQIETIKYSIKNDNFDGIVILATELYIEDIQSLINIDIPTVFLDAHYPYLHCHFVTMNNQNCVYYLIEHLVGLGHKRIGFVYSNSNASNFTARKEAFYKVMKHFNLEFNPSDYFVVDAMYDGTIKDMNGYLQSKKDMPKALLCVNDAIAIGVIKSLKQNGYKIPNDISVVGFDNLPAGLVIEPLLTTIEIPKTYLASFAINILNNQIRRGEFDYYENYEIDGKLIVRESTKKV